MAGHRSGTGRPVAEHAGARAAPAARRRADRAAAAAHRGGVPARRLDRHRRRHAALHRRRRPGERASRAGDTAAAVTAYEQAIELYRGDLCPGDTDLSVLIERERLRGVYLNVLARLAEHHLLRAEYLRALYHGQRLLSRDPCREDGHRMVMVCHARLGQRAQAMSQYRLCREILRREFDAVPEPATEELFRQLRSGHELAPQREISQTSLVPYLGAPLEQIEGLAAVDRKHRDSGRHNGSSR
nr:bacterial transcriptional activator domain-containing protein [Phytohabitans flavus]